MKTKKRSTPTLNLSPLQKRVRKARATLPFIKVNMTDVNGRPKDLFVPGTQSKTYNVILKRTNDADNIKRIFTECFVVPHGDSIRCMGSMNAVCYHALGALIYITKQKEFKIAICDTEQKAITRSRLGGDIFKVISRKAVNNPLWIVVSDPSKISTEEKIVSISHE